MIDTLTYDKITSRQPVMHYNQITKLHSTLVGLQEKLNNGSQCFKKKKTTVQNRKSVTWCFELEASTRVNVRKA